MVKCSSELSTAIMETFGWAWATAHEWSLSLCQDKAVLTKIGPVNLGCNDISVHKPRNDRWEGMATKTGIVNRFELRNENNPKWVITGTAGDGMKRRSILMRMVDWFFNIKNETCDMILPNSVMANGVTVTNIDIFELKWG